MVCLKGGIKRIHAAVVLAMLSACIMIVFCGTVYADDQSTETKQQMNAVSEQQPSDAEAVPVSSSSEEAAPAKGTDASSGEEAAPAKGTDASSGEEAVPAKGTDASSGEEAAPAKGTESSSGEEAAPAKGTDASSGEEAVPAKGTESSSGEEAAPAKGTDASSGEEAAPAKGTDTSSEEEAAPAKGTDASSGEDAAPVNATGESTGEKTVPANDAAASTGEKAAPAETAAPSGKEKADVTAALPEKSEQVSVRKLRQSRAATVMNSTEQNEESPEEDFDIRKQTITGLKFDEKTGVLSWDPLDAPGNRIIKYLIYMKVDNIKNEDFKIFSGSKGLVTKLSSTSVNVDEHEDFKEEFLNCGAADYTFYVKATDGTVGKDDYPLYSKEASTGSYSMGHYLLEVYVYTKVNAYSKKTNDFPETTRRASQSQGGEILMNGTSLTKIRGGGGGWYNAYTETRAVRAGTTVELKYVPVQGYIFYSEKLDNGSADTKASTTRTLTMDRAHTVVVLFKQPFAEVITNGIEASSDGLEDIAQSILLTDTEALKAGAEGYVQMNISQEYGKNLSDADKNICDKDSTLTSRKIKKGTFLNVEFYKSMNQEAPDMVSKLPKPANLTITIPDDLKSSKDTIRRTFYLIRVDNGQATVVGDTKYDELSGYITEPGLYMIGYKDTNIEGIYSGTSSSSHASAQPEPEPAPVYAAITKPESEPEPAPAVQASEPAPVIEAPEPASDADEGGIPVGAVAAGAAAAGAAYAAWKFLPAILGAAAK